MSCTPKDRLERAFEFVRGCTSTAHTLTNMLLPFSTAEHLSIEEHDHLVLDYEKEVARGMREKSWDEANWDEANWE